MRLLVTLFFTSISCLAFGQHEVVWKQNTPLTWDDFKGPVRNSVLAAETYCSINTGITVSGTKISVAVQAVFYPDSSWFNHEKIHELTLLHEQGHFHIAELYARKLRKIVKEEIITFTDYQNHFEKFYESIHKAYFDRQAQYDEETIHGTISGKQREWSDRITSELRELREYEN